MIRSSEAKRTEDKSAISIKSSRLLYSQMFTSSSLFKIVLLCILYGVLYFLLYILRRYYINSKYFSIMIILTITLFFFVFTATFYIFFTLTGTEIEKTLVKKIFPLLLLMGFLTAYFAIVIENKALTFVSIIADIPEQFSGAANLNANIDLVFYVYLVPIIEEIAKIFPILIVIGNFSRISVNGKNIVTPITVSHRTVVLYGAFFGAWFDLFEQYLSFSSTVSVIPNQALFNSLILTRSIYPLHSAATMITAFGLGWVVLLRNKYGKRVTIPIFVGSLLLASAFHGAWNFNIRITTDAILRANNQKILGYISYSIFALFILWILFKTPKLCPKCNGEHVSDKCTKGRQKDRSLKTKLTVTKRIKKELYDEESEMMLCPECQFPMYDGQKCLNCWSFPKLQCENCNQVIPPFSRNCWACGADVPTLYDKMASSSSPMYINFAVGFTRIIGVGLTIVFIFIFSRIQNTINFLGNAIFLLGVLISIWIAIFWFRSRNNRVKSMIVSVNVTSIVAVTIIMTSLYLSVFGVLLIISIFNLVFGIIGICLLLLLVAGSVYFLTRVIRGTNLIVT